MGRCPAEGLEASIHVLFLFGVAAFLAWDRYKRDDLDRPNRKQADWATALARFVCRRPLGIVSILLLTPRTSRSRRSSTSTASRRAPCTS